MPPNPSEDDAGSMPDPSSAVSAPVAAIEPEKPTPETVAAAFEVVIDLETESVNGDGAAGEIAAQSLAIEVTGARNGNGGSGPAIDVDTEDAAKVGAREMVTEENVDMTDVGEAKVVVEVGAEDAEAELLEEKVADKGHGLTAECGAESDAGAGGVGAQNVQVQEQGPPERRKRGRPRRATVEDGLHARYLYPFQDEKKDGFTVSDLVWGKVRSHPWWPGQIFDAADASAMALNAQKEGHFLVVYFGEKTFAWCDKSQLKPFQTCFTHLGKQGSPDAFGTAVNDALGEVSRIIELGMTCGCLSDEAYAMLKDRKFQNAGVREGTYGSSVDKYWIMNSFAPKKLIDYVQILAMSPCSGADRLDLVIAKAHLKAFRRSNGHLEPCVFVLGQGLENDDVSSPAMARNHGRHNVDLYALDSSDSGSWREKPWDSLGKSRKKLVLEDCRKKRSLSELMGVKSFACNAEGFRSGSEARQSLGSSGRRQKVANSCLAVSGKGKMKKLDSLRDQTAQSSNQTKQLKVRGCSGWVRGERMRSPTLIKTSLAEWKHRSAVPDYPNVQVGSPRVKEGDLMDSSPCEMLSQLCLAARNPLEIYSFLDTIVRFFTAFIDWLVSSSPEDKRLPDVIGGKQGRRKLSRMKKVSSDLATPDYIQDSYWSDIIICSNFDEEHGSEGRKRNGRSWAKRPKKKKRKKRKEQPKLYFSSVYMPKAEQYL
ncbi:hypothetical protein B296_00056685 [Ensete ventricosum]|uniref:PWWP domain-containing protein n=1 Tax=Ensete ventricosum TaxID=4639 RepID=A0A426XUT9_ENSVE|nr:hypothetical protein B296_00056685 [Ensete ventricosum]